jgi:hypothetical protein
MVLSAEDKREIAAMFQAFSERRPTPMRPEDMLLQAALDYATPRIASGAQSFADMPRFVPFPERVVGEAFETALVPSKRKKAMTKFNRAVKEGMKIVKASSSYGKKGTLNNSKKAFAAVTKSVSKARKGAKLTKKGVLRKVQQTAKKIIGKEVKRRKHIKSRKKKPFDTIAGSFLDPDMYYLGKRKGPG